MAYIDTLITIIRYIGYVGSAAWVLCVIVWLYCFVLELLYPWPQQGSYNNTYTDQLCHSGKTAPKSGSDSGDNQPVSESGF